MPALPETQAMNLLQTINLTWTQYRAFQTALAELKGCSDSTLSERGITRADLPRIAYEEAERSVEALIPSRPAFEQPVSWLTPAAA